MHLCAHSRGKRIFTLGSLTSTIAIPMPFTPIQTLTKVKAPPCQLASHPKDEALKDVSRTSKQTKSYAQMTRRNVRQEEVSEANPGVTPLIPP